MSVIRTAGETRQIRIQQAVINAHGGPMNEPTAKLWRAWFGRFVRERGIELVFMNEVTNRIHHAVQAELERQWDIERRHDRPGSDEVLLALRKTTGRVWRTRSLPMGGGRWIGAHTGALHTPRQMLEAQIDLDVVSLVAAVIHAPPSVDVSVDTELLPRRQIGKRVARRFTLLAGKADRVRAWRLYWRRFRRWAGSINRLGIPWVAGGDLQEPQRSRGWTSPVDTAARVGGAARLVGIDGWIYSATVEMVDVETVAPGPGMDHHVVIGTLVITLTRGDKAA